MSEFVARKSIFPRLDLIFRGKRSASKMKFEEGEMKRKERQKTGSELSDVFATYPVPSIDSCAGSLPSTL